MFLKRIQVVTQIVGSITLVQLTLYGVTAHLNDTASTSWAAQQIAKVTGGVQKAPLLEWGDNTVSLIINYQGHAKDHEAANGLLHNNLADL